MLTTVSPGGSAFNRTLLDKIVHDGSADVRGGSRSRRQDLHREVHRCDCANLMVMGLEERVGGLPTCGWQKHLLAWLAAFAAKDSRIRDLRPHGSASGAGTGVDRWSDLDLLITTEEPVVVTENLAQQISTRLSPVFASSRSGGPDRYTVRLVLSDLRRLDITAAVPSDRDGTLLRAGTAGDATDAMAELLNSFRFDAVLAAVKAAREDVLIGAHLTHQLAQHVLVAAMLLRDRDAGTNHHRFGGTTRWDAWTARLASAPTPYSRAGVTAAIRYYTDTLETLLTDWDPQPHCDNRPLLILLEAVDERDAGTTTS
ncbi:hypothetical protein ACH4TE_35465 [Streptomyces sioyaensis]|uniref:hypothetical protein n=1 Tax=Streptomyces sioyaensis TaxID=67364 RepID=UPI0037B7DD7D